ncbi:MAG: hypothetical protein NTV05_13215 [Acidobacteria bacterium]|nr:hypothetical protein [Acidobacteriota bacterium]
MANRVGIELLPYVCRIVEIRENAGLFGRSRGRVGDARVRTFREIPCATNSPARLTADLRQVLRGRRAVGRKARVVIWGLNSSHWGLLLPPAAIDDLLALARREARADHGSQPAPAAAPAFTSDGLVVGEIREGGRREVGYVSGSPDEVTARLQPLRDAGFEIEAVVTPALAHAALVRQRWPTSPDQVTAVLAVNARVTALTVLRGSVVLFSRELPWGSETLRSAHAGQAFDTSAMAGKLASELKRSMVYIKQTRQIDVSHVLVCGDTPDLRALTGPLMRELNVEVETLDGLDGLDVSRLPEPAAEFRATVAAWRPALGIASEAALPVDLQPRATGLSVSVTPDTRRRLAVAVVMACVVVGLAWSGASYLQDSTRARMQNLRRQIARLDPEVQRHQEARQAAATTTVQTAALDAFASQGPRLALVLDAFRLAPRDLAMNSLRLTSSPSGTWPLWVDGQTRSSTAANAQASFSRFLTSASGSKYLGVPTRSPEITIRLAGASPVGTILSFALTFEVRK